MLTGTFRFGRQTYNFRADIAQEGNRLVLSDVSLRPPISETKFAFDLPPRERAAALRARFVKGIDHPEPKQRGAEGRKNMVGWFRTLGAFAAANGFDDVRVMGVRGATSGTTANPGRIVDWVIDAQTGKHLVMPKAKTSP